VRGCGVVGAGARGAGFVADASRRPRSLATRAAQLRVRAHGVCGQRVPSSDRGVDTSRPRPPCGSCTATRAVHPKGRPARWCKGCRRRRARRRKTRGDLPRRVDRAPNAAEPRVLRAPPPRASACHGSPTPRAGRPPGFAGRRRPARPGCSTIEGVEHWHPHGDRATGRRNEEGALKEGRPHGTAANARSAPRSLTSEGDAALWPRHRMAVSDRRYSTARWQKLRCSTATATSAGFKAHAAAVKRTPSTTSARARSTQSCSGIPRTWKPPAAPATTPAAVTQRPRTSARAASRSPTSSASSKCSRAVSTSWPRRSHASGWPPRTAPQSRTGGNGRTRRFASAIGCFPAANATNASQGGKFSRGRGV
jgi:hypothetical protein